MARNRKITPRPKKINLSNTERDMLQNILAQVNQTYRTESGGIIPGNDFKSVTPTLPVGDDTGTIPIDDPIDGPPDDQTWDPLSDNESDNYRDTCQDPNSIQYGSASVDTQELCDIWFSNTYNQSYSGAGQSQWLIQDGCCYNLIGHDYMVLPGDINNDSIINVLDIVQLVNWVLDGNYEYIFDSYIPPYAGTGADNNRPGCTDESACNFQIFANNDDGSCVYPTSPYRDCFGNCLPTIGSQTGDMDGDGICDDEDEYPQCGTWLDQCGVCEGPGPTLCENNTWECNPADCGTIVCEDPEAATYNEEGQCTYYNCSGLIGVPDDFNGTPGSNTPEGSYITTCLWDDPDASPDEKCVTYAVYLAAIDEASDLQDPRFACESMPQYGYSATTQDWTSLNLTHVFGTFYSHLWDNGNIIGCQNGNGIDACDICGGDGSGCTDCSGYCCLESDGCDGELGAVNFGFCVNGVGEEIQTACTTDSNCLGISGGEGVVDGCGQCSTLDYGGCGEPNCSCTGCMETEALNYNDCYIWEGHTDGTCSIPCIGCCDFDYSSLLPYDFIKGGGAHPIDFEYRQYIGFSLPPKCGVRFGLDECTDQFLMCSNSSDSTAGPGSCEGLAEYADCGTGGKCVQYPIDYMMKISTFAEEPVDDSVSADPSLFTFDDILFTQQILPDTSSYFAFITFFTAGFFTTEDIFYDASGAVIEFEPSRGYYIQVVNDMWLKWTDPYSGVQTFSAPTGNCSYPCWSEGIDVNGIPSTDYPINPCHEDCGISCMDCDGNPCVSNWQGDNIYGPEYFMGDGFCDDGTFALYDENNQCINTGATGTVFCIPNWNCEEFNYDGGDCSTTRGEIQYRTSLPEGM